MNSESQAWLQVTLHAEPSSSPSCSYPPVASHSFGIQSGSCPHHEAFLIHHCCSCHSPFQSLFIYPTELGPCSLVRNQLSGTSFPLDGMLATGWLCPMLRDSARDGFVSSLLPMKMDTSLTLCLWVLLFALIIVGSSVCIVGSPNPRPGWEKAKPVCHTNTEYSDLTHSCCHSWWITP